MEERYGKSWGDVIHTIFENKKEIRRNVINPKLEEIGDNNSGFTVNQLNIINLVREMDLEYNRIINNAFDSYAEAYESIHKFHSLKYHLRNVIPS